MRNMKNLGHYGEQIVELASAYYRSRGIALLHKVPTEWKPLRRYDPEAGQATIVGAKVARKATVDFLGNWAGQAIAFDVKENSGRYWRLAQLEEHQRAFLAEWRRQSGIAFILLVNHPTRTIHLVPFDEYERRAIAAERKAGPTTIRSDAVADYPACPAIPGCPCDYLAAWQAAVARGLARLPRQASSENALEPEGFC